MPRAIFASNYWECVIFRNILSSARPFGTLNCLHTRRRLMFNYYSRNEIFGVNIPGNGSPRKRRARFRSSLRTVQSRCALMACA